MFSRGGEDPGPVSMLPKPGSRGSPAQASAGSTRPGSSDLSDLGASGAEVPPEWVLRRVDDVITEHFFKVEGMLDKFRRSIDDQQRSSSQQQDKVQEILTQVAILIEAQTHERRKGRERDQQLKQLQETLSSKAGQPLQTLGRALQRADDLPTRKFEKVDPAQDVGHQEKVLVQIDDLQSDLERSSARNDSSIRVLQGHLQVAENEIMALQGEVVLLQKRLQLQAVSGSVFSLKAADISRAERLRSLEALEKKQNSLKSLMERAEFAKTRGDASALLTELGVEGKSLNMASSPLHVSHGGAFVTPTSSRGARLVSSVTGDAATMNNVMEDKLNSKYQQYGLGDNEGDPK